VELKVFAGLTFREIAEVTGLPQATAASRYRRALAECGRGLTNTFRNPQTSIFEQEETEETEN